MRTRDRVIVRAYIDTGAVDRDCPACGAEPSQWCQTPDGRDRRVPCVDRATARPIDTAVTAGTIAGHLEDHYREDNR